MAGVSNSGRIPVAEPWLGREELENVVDCLRSGWISSIGRYIPEFETNFCAVSGARHGIATCNGTVALHLLLLSCGIGPGDEVIVPALTFVATANAVVHAGATPVFVDVDPVTWTLDVASMESRVTPRTRAVIAVHLYGHPADMDPIRELAERHRLLVIEDAAEAHGATYKHRPVGSLGAAAVFSFYGNKIITTGEGGMIVTDRDDIAGRARFLRDQAMDSTRRYWHPEVGYNYRMTNLQAAIGVAQVKRLPEMLARKRAIAAAYAERLQSVPGLALHAQAAWAQCVYWMYSIVVEDEFGISRDALAQVLDARGVETRPFFVALPSLPPYRGSASCPRAEQLALRGMNLPSSAKLGDEQIEYVCDVIRSARSSSA